MEHLTNPIHRLTRWFQRRRILRGFTFDLGDLTLDDEEIYLDLSSGRD